MALTKTVNYVQNSPQLLGFNNEISGTSGTITVSINFDKRGGSLSFPYYGSAYASSTSDSCGGLNDQWYVTGTEAEVNEVLNQLEWFPAAYDAANLPQNQTSLNRSMGDYTGELLIETENRQNNASFAVGDVFKINNGNRIGEFDVTAIETIKSQYRLYGAEKYRTGYEWAVPYECLLQDDTGATIDSIVDCAIINPAGSYLMNITVTSEIDGIVGSGTVTMVGGLFVPEPYFIDFPPAEIQLLENQDFVSTPLGQIAQTNNELVTVQVLLKRFESDPDFDGDVDMNKPSYIPRSDTREQYSCFNTVRVDNRVSEKPAGDYIWWQFYGSPQQCNAALRSLKFSQNSDRSLLVETRIVNSRARIYYTRGYN